MGHIKKLTVIGCNQLNAWLSLMRKNFTCLHKVQTWTPLNSCGMKWNADHVPDCVPDITLFSLLLSSLKNSSANSFICCFKCAIEIKFVLYLLSNIYKKTFPEEWELNNIVMLMKLNTQKAYMGVVFGYQHSFDHALYIIRGSVQHKAVFLSDKSTEVVL